VLPGGAWVAEQFDGGSSQFFDGRRPVADGKGDHWSGAEVVPARVLAADDLDIAAIGKLGYPQVRLGVSQCEAEHALMERCQLCGASCPHPAPAKARDLHACQYHCGNAGPVPGARLGMGLWVAAAAGRRSCRFGPVTMGV
jgi:hypothetical protein